MSETCVIEGKAWSRVDLEALPRDPDLRNLARWVQANERTSVSRSWIGSMASKSDLVRFLLGDGEARGSNDLKPSPNGKSDAASLMAQAVAAIAAQTESAVNADMLEDRLESVKNGLREEFEALVASQPKATRIEVVQPDGEVKDCGLQHKQFPVMMQIIGARVNAALVGPAGSGKTKAAHEAAKALGLEFEALSMGPQTTQSNIMGYMDANGNYVSTAFRRRFELGGVILFDEFDAGHAGVNTCVNAGTANEGCGFPDGYVARHPDFVCLLAMNTYGNGADRVYVGRNQLDGATMDRFAVIEWNYDSELELAISPDREWTAYVQAVRRAVETLKLRHVVSPRASIAGGKLLRAGLSREAVEKAVLWKGLASEEINKVKAAI